MNRRELAQEIKRKGSIFDTEKRPDGFYICLSTAREEVVFIVWEEEFKMSGAAEFNEDLVLIGGYDYKGSIDEASAALKEFLESEV